MLNSIVKFDLHIHSKASAYKENAGILAYYFRNRHQNLLEIAVRR